MATKLWRDVNAMYQIYPRSFMDSNGDGIGDLPGISQKLEYLKKLGVDGFWLSPVYASPQADCGYDVTDYLQIDSMFGSMHDMEALIERAHALDLKIMMDYVANHTSDQHAWFKQARLSKDNQYRDYYVWRDAKDDGSEPTNWISLAGGKAWTFDDATGQYYLHSFMPSQPDLNWDNPRVREEMCDVLRFWLDKGIDGFRVDAEWPISKIYEDDLFQEGCQDKPDEYGSYLHNRCKNGPNLLTYMKQMNDVMGEYDNRYMIFEYYTEKELGDEVQQYADIFAIDPEHSAPFVFDMFRLEWHAEQRASRMAELYARISTDSRPIHALGNHDQSRIVSQFGEKQARALAVAQMTLPGMPMIYYGEEIGMRDFEIPRDARRDNFQEGGGMGGRDPERTPMQWSNAMNAGFSTAEPWLPIAQDYEDHNVELELHDLSSFLSLYRSLFQMRQHYPVLRNGTYLPLNVGNGYIWAYRIYDVNDSFDVVINFADQPQVVNVTAGRAVISSETVRPSNLADGQLTLAPFEALLLKSAGTAS